jgi:ketosteroid isomerase-like protein
VDTERAARAWIDGWREAWLAEDPDRVAALYAEEAVFVSHPFRDPHHGTAGARAYAKAAFGDETALDVRFGEPFVHGDRAAIEYWAILEAEGRELTLAGVALVEFDGDGKVSSQRDYWAMEPGRREPPAGWGA